LPSGIPEFMKDMSELGARAEDNILEQNNLKTRFERGTKTMDLLNVNCAEKL